MNHRQALSIAEIIKKEMSPYCNKIEIAGSIRRGKEEVKDIELVVVPRFENEAVETVNDLFSHFDSESREFSKVNQLHKWAKAQKLVEWIKPGTSEIVPWEVKPDGKYWRGLVRGFSKDPIKLDLFLAATNNFGVIYTIRTGSAEFSNALVAFIKLRTAFRVQGGNLTQAISGEFIPCPDEKSFFENAGIEFVPVYDRSDSEPYRHIGHKIKL